MFMWCAFICVCFCVSLCVCACLCTCRSTCKWRFKVAARYCPWSLPPYSLRQDLSVETRTHRACQSLYLPSARIAVFLLLGLCISVGIWTPILMFTWQVLYHEPHPYPWKALHEVIRARRMFTIKHHCLQQILSGCLRPPRTLAH